MLWVIIIIVAFIIIKFLMDAHKQAEYVTKQGGMRKKYATLVDYILEGDSRAKIVQESSTFLNIGSASPGGSTSFFLTQTFGTLTVEWKSSSLLFGKNKLEWQFDEFLDQEEMIKKINHDIEQYMINLSKKFT